MRVWLDSALVSGRVYTKIRPHPQQSIEYDKRATGIVIFATHETAAVRLSFPTELYFHQLLLVAEHSADMAYNNRQLI